MPSMQITVPNDKGGQKFTIGEIARMILETHESSPTVGAQIVISEILRQAEVGEPPGINPDKEIILFASAGHPYKSAASATKAARTRADLQNIDWEIVSVDGGWGIRDITIYTNWFEYWADKDALTADEISYKVLVSTADMTRLCRSTVYREWASPLGLGVPVMFGGEGTPLAKGQEDSLVLTQRERDELGPQTVTEIDVTQGDTRETEHDAPRSDGTPSLAPVNAETTDIEAEYAQRVKDHRIKTGWRPTFKADNEWRKDKGLKRDALRDLRLKNCTDEEKRGGHPPRS